MLNVLVMELMIICGLDWVAFENNLKKASEKAVIATNLHFCAKMSNGEEISNGVDNFLWEGMDCDKIIERAFEFGFKKEEVIKIINEAKKPVMQNKSSGESSFELEGFKGDLKASLKRGREEFEQKYSIEIEEIQESSEKIFEIYKQHGLID